MQIYVLDRSKNVLATTEGFYNDLHHKELTAGASTYVFDLSKSDEATQYMVSGNIITMLDDQGRPWSFEILYYDEYQTYKTIHCEDVGINLFNKACDFWYYTDAKPFADYFNVITDGTPWELGVNQLADLSRTLTFTGRDTGLGRLLSVLKAFDDAECIFNIQMKGPVPVKYVIDVYKKIGTVQDNIQIAYNEELDNIQKTETRQEFVTALAGVGSVIQDTETDADGSTVDTNKPQEHVDFKDLEYDDGGFYTVKGDKFLRARTANQQFNPGDQGFIEDFYEYDTASNTELFNRTLAQIRTRSQPQFKYEADVKVIDPNLDIGDTVTIIDHDYNPALYLQARVATLDKSYTDSTQGQITFTNYVVLTDTVTQQIAALKSKVNGIKNGSSSYVWIRYADDDQGTNISQSPKNKTYVAILAKINQPVPSDNPNDYVGHWVRIAGEDGLNGQIGPQGPAGTNGIPGKDGKSSYTHIAYANSATGEGFSEQPGGKTYIGMYVDFDVTDSTDVTKYNWSLVKGSDGANGTPGKPGADGKTPYLHTAYSWSADGQDRFTTVYPGENLALDTSTSAIVQGNSSSWQDIKRLNLSQNPAGLTVTFSYAVTIDRPDSGSLRMQFGANFSPAWGMPISVDFKSLQPGVKTNFNKTIVFPTFIGAGNFNDYMSIGLANSSALVKFEDLKVEIGNIPTPWTPSPLDDPEGAYPKFMGTYTDYTQADPTDPTKYIWSLIKGEAGANGKDGQDAYLHIAYANSVDGKTNFTTDQNQAHNRDYLGTYSDNTKAQSTDPNKYIWQLTRGAQGIQGQPGAKDVPVVIMSSTAPSNPKDGDFWYQTTTDANGQKITGFSVYSSGKWVPSKIDQSTLVLTKLVSVEIDSATINSPDISIPYSYYGTENEQYTGSFEIKDGNILSISTITYPGQTTKPMQRVLLGPNGYSNAKYEDSTHYTANDPISVATFDDDGLSMKMGTTNTGYGITGMTGDNSINGDGKSNIGINFYELFPYMSDTPTDPTGIKSDGSKFYTSFDLMSGMVSHPNLLKNSSFKDGFNNWDNDSGWFTYGGGLGVHQGNVVAISHGNNSNLWLGQMVFNVLGNQKMSYSFWLFQEGDKNADGGIELRFENDDASRKSTFKYAIESTIPNNEWTYVEILPTISPDWATRAHFAFYNRNSQHMLVAQPMLCYGDHIWPYQPT